MEQSCYVLELDKYKIMIELNHRCSRYKLCLVGPYYDEFGNKYKRIYKHMTYTSIEDMEADINCFLDFIEYMEGSEIDEEDEYHGFEKSAGNDQR